MKEFKVTYFFDKEHYVRRFIFVESQEDVENVIQRERGQYISFTDSRGIYHELNTEKVRLIQISEYHRVDKTKKEKETYNQDYNFYS